jgi:hypothetical protein
MAETEKGNKIVVVQEHKRKQAGKVINVPKHGRSTPQTSKGKK